MSQGVLGGVGMVPNREQTSVADHAVNLPSRKMTRVSLKAGNREFLVNMTQTTVDIAHNSSLDDEEEHNRFEALLNPSILLANGNGKSDDMQREKETVALVGTL